MTPKELTEEGWYALLKVVKNAPQLLYVFYTLKRLLYQPKIISIPLAERLSNFAKKKGATFLLACYKLICERYKLSFTFLRLIKNIQQCIVVFLNPYLDA